MTFGHAESKESAETSHGTSEGTAQPTKPVAEMTIRNLKPCSLFGNVSMLQCKGGCKAVPFICNKASSGGRTQTSPAFQMLAYLVKLKKYYLLLISF